MSKRRFAGLLALASALVVLPAAAAGGTAFPVTVKSSNGTVTLAEKPTRIVSLSPTATEDLFAIGAGKQVVAVDSDSNYPASAPITKLSAYTPNAEAIAKYNPDLVVIAADENDIAEALGKLHIPVLLQTPANDFGEAYAQLTTLGEATGQTAGAAREVAKLKQQIAAVIASVPKSAKGMTVYDELSPDYYSATSKTFIGQALSRLGLRDIADKAGNSGSGYPKLSAEYIVAADPQLIVLSDTKCCGQTAAKVKARPGWNTIAAVQNDGVVGVDDDIASRWGPRIVDFMRDVAAQIKIVAAK
jgi:iron complex transport system substrate-binding protein